MLCVSTRVCGVSSGWKGVGVQDIVNPAAWTEGAHPCVGRSPCSLGVGVSVGQVARVDEGLNKLVGVQVGLPRVSSVRRGQCLRR